MPNSSDAYMTTFFDFVKKLESFGSEDVNAWYVGKTESFFRWKIGNVAFH